MNLDASIPRRRQSDIVVEHRPARRPFFEMTRRGSASLLEIKALGERRRRHLHAALVELYILRSWRYVAALADRHLVAGVQHRTEARPRLGLRLAQSGELAAPF